jgi:acyl carrier protein
MTRTDVETAVRTALADLTGAEISGVASGEDLGAAIGLDSLGRLELLAEVEDRFDLFFLDADSESASTINGMVEIVQREMARAEEAA